MESLVINWIYANSNERKALLVSALETFYAFFIISWEKYSI